MSGRGPDFVHALAKGLEILAAFDRNCSLGNQELVERTGFPKATVARLTGTLADLGYLHYDKQARRYQIGNRILGLSANVHRNLGLHNAARPLMEALARELDVTVIAASRDRTAMVFLDLVRPAHNELTVNTDTGSLVPMESTAVGLAYIVASPLADRIEILNDLRAKYPDNDPVLRRRIEQAHDEYARHGFVVSQRSWSSPVNAVSVPLALPGGKGIFSFGCAGPASQLTRTLLVRKIGPRLIEMVRELRETLLKARPPRVTPRERVRP